MFFFQNWKSIFFATDGVKIFPPFKFQENVTCSSMFQLQRETFYLRNPKELTGGCIVQLCFFCSSVCRCLLCVLFRNLRVHIVMEMNRTHNKKWTVSFSQYFFLEPSYFYKKLLHIFFYRQIGCLALAWDFGQNCPTTQPASDWYYCSANFGFIQNFVPCWDDLGKNQVSLVSKRIFVTSRITLSIIVWTHKIL